MENEKKVYTPPTITDHGKVVKETKGITDSSWELYGHTLVNDPKGN